MGNICCNNDGKSGKNASRNNKGANGKAPLRKPRSAALINEAFDLDTTSKDTPMRKRRTLVKNAKNAKFIKKIDNIRDHYELYDRLGTGNFGAVYKAKRKGFDTIQALKVVGK